MQPAGFDFHLFVSRHHAVVGLHRSGDAKLSTENLFAGRVERANAIRGSVWRGIEFVQRDFIERHVELAREHFINGINFLHPPRRRKHRAHSGSINILCEIYFDRRNIFSGEGGRDFIHQPAVSLFVRAQHFHVKLLSIGASFRKNIFQLGGELLAFFGTFADPRNQCDRRCPA